MGLLDAIRSALGLGSSSRDEEPDASTERAVKDSPAAAGTDASGSTSSVAETPDEDDVAAATEPAEAAGPASQVESADEATLEDIEAAESSVDEPGDAPDDAALPDDDVAAETTLDDGRGDPSSVETISGIGPAYASRLADAGVESVPDLLAADADALADKTDISAKRISRWMERAAEE
jgi:predicted flap endonuclease-1-like 5' DNA nuclease